jgi:hypothetical protein
MAKRCKAPPSDQSVSASELAQMGRCERLVMFEHLHGRRRTDSRKETGSRGYSHISSSSKKDSMPCP